MSRKTPVCSPEIGCLIRQEKALTLNSASFPHIAQASITGHLFIEDLPCAVLRASVVAQTVKTLPATQETRVWSLGQEDPLEKGKATHSSILTREHPMDRGARWAAVYGTAESARTARPLLLCAEHWLCTTRLGDSGLRRQLALAEEALESQAVRVWPGYCVPEPWEGTGANTDRMPSS